MHKLYPSDSDCQLAKINENGANWSPENLSFRCGGLQHSNNLVNLLRTVPGVSFQEHDWERLSHAVRSWRFREHNFSLSDVQHPVVTRLDDAVIWSGRLRGFLFRSSIARDQEKWCDYSVACCAFLSEI